ncbi:MAG: VWA domain-containing protein, partial [Pseudomonadota bacterium]
WNAEAGAVWLARVREKWPSAIWINPIPSNHWGYTHSIGMIQEIFTDRMYPMTLKGIEAGIKELGR